LTGDSLDFDKKLNDLKEKIAQAHRKPTSLAGHAKSFPAYYRADAVIEF
jgi:hypothetical protein